MCVCVCRSCAGTVQTSGVAWGKSAIGKSWTGPALHLSSYQTTRWGIYTVYIHSINPPTSADTVMWRPPHMWTHREWSTSLQFFPTQGSFTLFYLIVSVSSPQRKTKGEPDFFFMSWLRSKQKEKSLNIGFTLIRWTQMWLRMNCIHYSCNVTLSIVCSWMYKHACCAFAKTFAMPTL